MCGLVAVMGSVPPEALALAVSLAARRGPHSWGWVDMRTKERLTGSGSLGAPPRGWEQAALGHSRLATSTGHSGSMPDPAESQPLVSASMVLAHNGTFEADEAGVSRGRRPSDSWTLLEALKRGTLPDFGGRPQAFLYYRPGTKVVLARRIDGRDVPAHPLYLTDYPLGRILSSGPLGDSSRLLASGVEHSVLY